MSKSIRSYPKQERERVINRRLTQKVKGLGYWAAHDARKSKRFASPLDRVIDKIRKGG